MKLSLFKNLSLVVELGAEVLAIANVIKAARSDGRITQSERQAIYQRLGALFARLGAPIDLNEQVLTYDQKEAEAVSTQIFAAVHDLLN